MIRVLLEPVFVLHQRPYQNSSLIVELFSQQFGRVCVLARSARGPKSRFQGFLQPFAPLLASWSGRRELMHLNALELSGSPLNLNGQALFCGFYLNELLLRLLQKEDPEPSIFFDYRAALTDLEKSNHIAVVLRRFEKRLLHNLGYGLNLKVDSQEFYRWTPSDGLSRYEKQGDIEPNVFSGRSLLALQQEQWDHPEDLLAAKQLMRLVLKSHLGGKPLKSRDCFELLNKIEEK
ncbi:MAG: DNA repair protein RecO [Proteobacteria bacterium]|nr:DNA repair protein RecO [Pseudomonadota bacterium]